MIRPILIVLATFVVALPAPGQEPTGPSPTLRLVAIDVTPDKPGKDTLCQLVATVANDGDQTATSLGFAVEVEGRALPVYENLLYLQAIPPGEETEVRLYNFWVAETDRPAPTDGSLDIRIALDEARWIEISTDDEGVEVWTPTGDVAGLPSTLSLAVPLAR